MTDSLQQEPRDRPVIEVTPAMIEAGERWLRGSGLIPEQTPRWEVLELAADTLRAGLAAKLPVQ